MNRIANSSCCHKPRGNYVIDAIFKATSDANAINGAWLALTDGTAANFYVQFTVTEPLFLSPFLLGLSSKEDHSGIFSVNALNFTINFSQSANRAWRSARFVNPGSASAAAPTYQTKTATLINVSNNSSIFCKFYTPKATMLDNPRCVVPYHEFQIFKTSISTTNSALFTKNCGRCENIWQSRHFYLNRFVYTSYSINIINELEYSAPVNSRTPNHLREKN